jgi:site-specific recombinase XerD
MSNIIVQNVPSIASDKNLHALITRYFAEEVAGKSVHTFKAKAIDLRKFFQFYNEINKDSSPNRWSPRDTKLFILHLEREDYKPASINRMLASLRSFGSWLQNQGIVRIHPCHGVKDLLLEPLRPKRISDLEFHRFRKTAEALTVRSQSDASQDFRNLVLLELLNASGLRIFEILGLKLNQLAGKKLVGVRCKNGRVRDVLIRQEAADLIREYIKDYRTGSSDLIFLNRYGGPLSRNSVARAFNKIAAVAGATLADGEKPRLRPHLLRHLHAYKAREAKDAVFAAKRLGHSSLAYIERYAGLDDIQEEKILEDM